MPGLVGHGKHNESLARCRSEWLESNDRPSTGQAVTRRFSGDLHSRGSTLHCRLARSAWTDTKLPCTEPWTVMPKTAPLQDLHSRPRLSAAVVETLVRISPTRTNARNQSNPPTANISSPGLETGYSGSWISANVCHWLSDEQFVLHLFRLGLLKSGVHRCSGSRDGLSARNFGREEQWNGGSCTNHSRNAHN